MAAPPDEARRDTGPAGDRPPADRSVAPDEVLPASRQVAGVPEIEEGDDQREPPGDQEQRRGDAIEQPAKVMRIGSMVKQLLEEVRQAPLDEKSRSRLREIYEQSVRELASGLSPDLAAELDRVALPFDGDVPSEAELRVAQAQLVGWLEGLFHGIQATLMAQQMAARAQLDEMRQRGLPRGADGGEAVSRPGTYL
jgi:hypothetical protein